MKKSHLADRPDTPDRRGATQARDDGASDPTSSVQKACRILSAMSDARNVRLTDIARASGQDKATTLRLLEGLAREGFIVRDPHTKHYALGPESFLLGAAAAARHDPRPIARPSLLRLATAFEDSVILSVPRGSEAVCVDLALGCFPIRANYLEVGSRRPLGAGAGSLALLAWMPDAEIDTVIDTIGRSIQKRYPGISEQVLRNHIASARAKGYAVMLDLVVERMGGIAMPILARDGRPVAAISLAALTERIVGREQALANSLAQEVAACERLDTGLLPPATDRQ